jgi:predicted transcriptional regulator
MSRDLTELGESLLSWLAGGPMTTNELRTAEAGRWSSVYPELMKLYRKGLVARLPDVNDSIGGSRTVLWWRP